MNYQFLANTRLFRGISVDELEKMLTCFSVQTRQYEKGSLILRAGQMVSAIGLVLSGNITIENNDLWGNRTVMDRLGGRRDLCRVLCPDTGGDPHGRYRCK